MSSLYVTNWKAHTYSPQQHPGTSMQYKSVAKENINISYLALLAYKTQFFLKVLGKKQIYPSGKNNKFVEKTAFREPQTSPSKWAFKGLVPQHLLTARIPFKTAFLGGDLSPKHLPCQGTLSTFY